MLKTDGTYLSRSARVLTDLKKRTEFPPESIERRAVEEFQQGGRVNDFSVASTKRDLARVYRQGENSSCEEGE